ncbi:hypothetical protein ACU4GD_04200 [Cupriavidus basilensis]
MLGSGTLQGTREVSQAAAVLAMTAGLTLAIPGCAGTYPCCAVPPWR